MSTAELDRQRLFSLPLLIVLGALIVLALVLVFPKRELERRLFKNRTDDVLTAAYLRAWLLSEPDNTSIMAHLAREYAREKDLGQAQAMLDRVIREGNRADRQDALLIQIEMAETTVYAHNQSPNARQQGVAELARLLRDALAYSWPVPELTSLAQKAAAIGDNAVSIRYYDELAKIDPVHAIIWLDRQGKLSLGAGHYRAAADAYFDAQNHAHTLDGQRTYFLKGIAALQSGNLLPEAVAGAEQHLGVLSNDEQTLRAVIRLALAAARPDVADRYARRLLQMSLLLHGPPTARLANIDVGHARQRIGRPDFVVWRMPPDGRWADVAVAVQNNRQPLAHWVRTALEQSGQPVAPAGAKRQGNDGKTHVPSAAPKAPFNAEDYRLAYQVFLANGDLAAARRVAESAVAQRPDLPEWHERLAQVAEWAGDPHTALEQYWALARQRGDEKTWRQVLRLAGPLDDNRALLDALLHEVDVTPGNLDLIGKVVAAYELVGMPDEGLRFLAAHAHGALRRPILERYATLAGRAGNDDLAFQTYSTLEHDYGPNPAYALKLALLLYTRTRFASALDALKRAAPQARAAVAAKAQVAPVAGAALTGTPEDKDISGKFWSVYALLGRLVQQNASAKEADREILLSGKIESADLATMISDFDDSPLDAGRLAEFAYRRTGDVRTLQQALYYDTRAGALPRVAQILRSLDARQLADAGQSPDFLLARAEYHRVDDRLDLALQDIRRALQLAPNNAEARTAYLWALNDRGSDAELRTALARFSNGADQDPALRDAFAAAYLRLGEGRPALHYLHRQLPAAGKDPLWLLSYADALELNNRADEAWQVRRHVWAMLRKAQRTSPSDTSALDASARNDLRARMVGLTDQFQGGDASRRLLLALLHQNTANAAPNEARIKSELGDIDLLPPLKAHALVRQHLIYSSAIREAGIAWAQSHDAYTLEKAWLAQQYLKRLTQPAYADITIALAEQDTVTLNRLLDELPDQLPRQNKIDAEIATGRIGAAQTDAYRGQSALPDDPTLNAALREQLLASAQALAPGWRSLNQGALKFTEESLGAGVRLAPNQAFQFRFIDRHQEGDNITLFGVPAHDRRLDMTYRWFGINDTGRMTVTRRDALRDFTAAQAEGTWRDGQPVNFNYLLGYNQEASETAQLQVAGVKDQASIGVNWKPGNHWFGSARGEYDRFFGQDRSFLGTGKVLEINFGYRLRTGYPDYTARMTFTRGLYDASGTPGIALQSIVPAGGPFTAAQFVPQSFTQIGLLVGFGSDLADGYTQAWRPFVEFGPIHDSNAGWGWQINSGMGGSVFGTDQLMLYYNHESISQHNSAPVTEFGARYRWLY